MEKALLLIRKETDWMESTKRALMYCKERNFKLMATQVVDMRSELINPEIIIQEIQKKGVDVVLCDDELFLISEKANDKSLLSRLEDAEIDCIDITTGVRVRDIFDYIELGNIEELDIALKRLENVANIVNSHFPVVVLYEGTKNYEKDDDFKNIMQYINEHLKEQKIDVIVYPHKDDRILSEIIDAIGIRTPNFIVTRKNIELGIMKKFLDKLQEHMGVKVIDMETVNLHIQQEAGINVNLKLN